MKESTPWMIAAAAVVVVVAGLGGWYWYQQRTASAVPELPPVAVATPPAPPASATPAQPPEIQHPIEAAAAALEPADAAASGPLPALDSADAQVQSALVDVLGRKPVLSFLQTDRFVQRVVATVDNLPRQTASARLWPAQPLGGSFVVEQRADGLYLGAANAARHDAFVRFVEAIDTRRAVGLYVRMYPLFQQAYEELGYPGRYFNDRLVEVIDHLLASPEPAGPIKVRRLEVSGPYQPVKPWAVYEIDDAELEARSAGQKMMLRMGRGNEQRLKAKLVDLRRQVARADVKRGEPVPPLQR